MRRSLILGIVLAAALAAGIAVAVAATRGSGGADKTTGATVSVKRIGGAGAVLVDSAGHALYRSDQERHGMVLCTGACLSFWQPLTVSGTPRGRSLPGTLAVHRRPDGSRQVTYDGRLLYRFKLDKAGKVAGDGFKDAFGSRKFTWHVVHPTAVKGATGSPSPTPTYPGY